jgi:hypothetical protein
MQASLEDRYDVANCGRRSTLATYPDEIDADRCRLCWEFDGP